MARTKTSPDGTDAPDALRAQDPTRGNTRIAPNADGTEALPRSGGSWLREADGGLTPLDEATAAGAGLVWPSEPPPAA